MIRIAGNDVSSSSSSEGSMNFSPSSNVGQTALRHELESLSIKIFPTVLVLFESW